MPNGQGFLSGNPWRLLRGEKHFLSLIRIQQNKIHLRGMKTGWLFLFIFLFSSSRAASFSSIADSSKYKILSLDSLSDEDYALLEEYKDSFMQEVKLIKSTLGLKKAKSIDTTVALMNRSSHCEISLDVTGPILSNGRSTSLKGAAFYPSVMYYHKTGLYASLSMGFYTDSAVRKSAALPLVAFSTGFYRTFFKRWTFSIGYSRNFTLYQEKVYQGMLNNSFNLFNSFNFWNYLTIGVSSSVSWSSNLTSRKYLEVQLGQNRPPRKIYYKTFTNDIGQAYGVNVALSLRKDFSFFNILGAKIFTLSPELYFIFGHDNSAFLIQGFRQPGQSPLTYDKFFGLLDIEPGFSVDWRIRNLEIFGSFHVAIPFNDYNETTYKRVVNPKEYHPYGSGGVKYLFRIKPKASKHD